MPGDKVKSSLVRSVIHFLAFAVPPILVAPLAGVSISWVHYAIYCICLLPLQAVRRFVFGKRPVSIGRLTAWLLYSMGLSATLVWAVVANSRAWD